MYKKIISVMSVALMVFLCTNFGVFANTTSGAYNSWAKTFDLDGTSANIISASVRATSFWYTEDSYFQSGSIVDGKYDYEVLVRVSLINNSDNDIKLDTTNFTIYLVPQNNYPSNVFFRPVDYKLQSGIFSPVFMASDGQINFAVSTDSSYITSIVIPAKSVVTSIFTITYELSTYTFGSKYNPPEFSGDGIRWSYPTLPLSYSTSTDLRTDNIGYIQLLYLKFKEFLNSYNANVPASQNVTSDASTSSNVIDSQHQQESNIYNQTNQAIGNTGIQNFQFDSQTIGGLGGVKNDFMAVWNSLGSFNSVFITSLTIGLALSIVRHRRMFKQ